MVLLLCRGPSIGPGVGLSLTRQWDQSKVDAEMAGPSCFRRRVGALEGGEVLAECALC